MNEPLPPSPVWFKVALTCIALVAVLFAGRFASQAAQYNALDAARLAAAERAVSSSHPHALKLFLAECATQGPKQLRRAEEVEYSPWAWQAFQDTDTRVIDDLSALILRECSEAFVLNGSTAADMQARTEMTKALRGGNPAVEGSQNG